MCYNFSDVRVQLAVLTVEHSRGKSKGFVAKPSLDYDSSAACQCRCRCQCRAPTSPSGPMMSPTTMPITKATHAVKLPMSIVSMPLFHHGWIEKNDCQQHAARDSTRRTARGGIRPGVACALAAAKAGEGRVQAGGEGVA